MSDSDLSEEIDGDSFEEQLKRQSFEVDSDSGEGGSDEEESSEEDAPPPQDNSALFGNAIGNILGKRLRQPEAPILRGKKRAKNEVDVVKAKKKAENDARLAKELLLSKERMMQPQFDRNEKRLVKVATKGVVTLFNAISQRQKEAQQVAEEKAQKQKQNLKAKAPAGSQDIFLKSLKNKALETQTTQPAPTEEADAPKAWNILSDDYLMGQGMKNWDQESESEEEQEQEQEREVE